MSAAGHRANVHRVAASLPKKLTESVRQHYALEGVAEPDGSYPIPDVAALKKAIRAYGRSKDPSATRRHIIERARVLGASNLIPPHWQ